MDLTGFGVSAAHKPQSSVPLKLNAAVTNTATMPLNPDGVNGPGSCQYLPRIASWFGTPPNRITSPVTKKPRMAMILVTEKTTSANPDWAEPRNRPVPIEPPSEIICIWNEPSWCFNGAAPSVLVAGLKVLILRCNQPPRDSWTCCWTTSGRFSRSFMMRYLLRDLGCSIHVFIAVQTTIFCSKTGSTSAPDSVMADVWQFF
ncbi:hypothetical protein OGAPHI_003248 [Ogataea philodendri]|uniref:Uncharacterized protein n=1 Tax=Ogataea philodendri TaxID=1378263 RepID=A0A9P8T5X3_9ASCO|nr:uncharacterized protein OGAPHI_003248 [Ogataea philodendri]KAH3666799.1 hypothetical protein OGAPHI_003248 [Ogataea philodendri]